MVIAILLTSTLLTMLGIAGVIRGVSNLSMAPIKEDVRELYDPDVELTDAAIQLFEAQLSNPYRRPMAASNVAVSALVLIGSFLLSWRRRLALWWIKQAVTAKLLWIVAYTVTLVSHIQQSFNAVPSDQPEGMFEGLVGGVVLISTFNGALHVAAAYRANRPDIRQFIETAAAKN
ncbi:MAG: hypothetical protein ACN4G0_05885 [Polyangiales bacterium]